MQQRLPVKRASMSWLSYRLLGRAHSYYMSSITGVGTLSLSTDLIAYLLYISQSVFANAISIEVTAGAASALLTLGIYQDTGEIHPGTLIPGTNVGDIDASTTGLKRATFSPVLLKGPGVYWVAVQASVGGVEARIIGNILGAEILGRPINTSFSSGGPTNVRASVNPPYASALPSPFPTAETQILGSAVIMWVELASNRPMEARLPAALPYDKSRLSFRKSGRAHFPASDVPTLSGATTTNAMHALAFYVPVDIVVNALSTAVTEAGAAGTRISLGIYENDNAYPTTLVAGTAVTGLDGATTGLKRSTFTPVRLQGPQLYWLVLYTEGDPTVRTFEFGTGIGLIGYATNTGYTGEVPSYWRVTRTYDNTMPSTFPSGASRQGTASPGVAVEVV